MQRRRRRDLANAGVIPNRIADSTVKSAPLVRIYIPLFPDEADDPICVQAERRSEIIDLVTL